MDLAHHPLELMEVEAAVAVDVVGPDHGLAVGDRPLVTELREHPLQAPRRDPAGGLDGVEHLEGAPQVLFLAVTSLHQGNESGEVEHVAGGGAAAARRRRRHLVAHGREERAQLGAGDLAVVVPVEVLEDPVQLALPSPRRRRTGGGGGAPPPRGLATSDCPQSSGRPSLKLLLRDRRFAGLGTLAFAIQETQENVVEKLCGLVHLSANAKLPMQLWKK